MNSEKVKEIKNALECCAKKNRLPCTTCIKSEETDVVLTCRSLLEDILTLINELESENERLKTSEFNSCQELDNACTQIHSLEDRIYELEYGIAKSMLGCEFLPECTNEKLKQFAEMLKKKYGKSCSEYYPLLLELTSEQLDETLNKFLKGGNNE